TQRRPPPAAAPDRRQRRVVPQSGSAPQQARRRTEKSAQCLALAQLQIHIVIETQRSKGSEVVGRACSRPAALYWDSVAGSPRLYSSAASWASDDRDSGLI